MDPGFETGIASVEALRFSQHLVEALLVPVFPEDRVLQEWERDDVRGGELVTEQVLASGEQILEERQRRSDLLLEIGDPVRSGSGFASSSTIRFGGRFQTRLNQSTNVRNSARRAGSAG